MRPRRTSRTPRRRLALESLERRDTPAADLPLNIPLAIEGYEQLTSAALLASGNYRVGGYRYGVQPSLWEFDAAGNLVSEAQLGLAPGQTFATLTAMSPNGRWLGGQQSDMDFSNGYHPLFVIWDGDRPESFVEIDISSIAAIPSAHITDISNDGVVTLQSEGMQTYRWDAVHGLQRLTSLYEVGGNSTPDQREAQALAISADGSTIVGSSGYTLDRRPTVWTASGLRELPTPSGQQGEARRVSADGRIVGGELRSGTAFRPAVWANGQLVLLTDAQGEPAKGQISAVVNGLGGDPNRWMAFGSFNQRGWVATSDGVVQSLDAWLETNYDLTFHGSAAPSRDGFSLFGSLGSGVLEAYVQDGALQLAAHDWVSTGQTASIPPSIFYAPTSPRWIVAPLAATGQPPGDHPFDTNADGAVSPLDALLIINAINDQSAAGQPASSLGLLDINGDGLLTPLDCLIVLNHLNQRSVPQPPFLTIAAPDSESDAEGEAAATDAALALWSLTGDDCDVQTARRRRAAAG